MSPQERSGYFRCVTAKPKSWSEARISGLGQTASIVGEGVSLSPPAWDKQPKFLSISDRNWV